MSRDWRLDLGDMTLCCEKIATFAGTSTRDEFLANVLVYDAVLRNLENLARAAKHVPTEVKARMHDLAWREIARIRDWITYDYFTIKADLVWNAIEVEVPLLLRTLQAFKDENPLDS